MSACTPMLLDLAGVSLSLCRPDLATSLALGMVAALVVAAALAHGVSLARRPGRRLARATALILSLLAAGLLLVAALAPRQVLATDQGQRTLAVVLDISDSTRRGPGGADPAHRFAPIADLSDQIAAAATGPTRIAVIATAATAAPLLELDPAAMAARRQRPPPLPDTLGAGSDLAAGLERALAAVAGSRGQIVLLSDGLHTGGDLAAILARARAAGVAIHTLALDPAPAVTGITALALPPRVAAGQPVRLRLTLCHPAAAGGTTARLAVASADWAWSAGAALLPGRCQPLRLTLPPLTSQGLQGLNVELTLGQDSQPRQSVVRHILVVDQPRLLVAGADPPWLPHLPAGRFRIARVSGTQPFAAGEAELVVLDTVEPDPATAAALAADLAADRRGVFLIQGHHAGGDTAQTRLGRWDAGPLGPMLPVSVQPRPEEEEAPPRRIIVIADMSGSMAESGRLARARSAAWSIISRLRPQDQLELVEFRGGGALTRRLDLTAMDQAGQRRAWAVFSGLTPQGGTDIGCALVWLAGTGRPDCPSWATDFRFDDCAAFIITDGELGSTGAGRYSLRCKTAVMVVGDPAAARDITFAEACVVLEGGGGTCRFSLLTPQPRLVTWDATLRLPGFKDGFDTLHPPAPLGVDGVAVSYFRPGAERVAEMPVTFDPVLAFRRVSPAAAGPGLAAGRSGVFTGALAGAWASPAGGATIARWFEHLLGWSQRDRLLLAVDQGADGRQRLRLVELGSPGPEGAILALDAALERDGLAPLALAIAEDPERAGQWQAPLPAGLLGPGRHPATLALTIARARARPQPQRIPVSLVVAEAPDQASRAEQETAGLDAALLARLAAETGGRAGSLVDGGVAALAPLLVERFAGTDPVTRPLAPWLLALAAMLVVAATALWRWARG